MLQFDKLQFLKELYEKYGNYYLACMFKNTDGSTIENKSWTEWKLYTECTEEELLQANLRQILPDELILDSESEEHFQSVYTRLNNTFNSLQIWKTGSRGYHVQIMLNKLSEQEPSIATAIRLFYINEFGMDKTKKSQNTMVALELSPHFKTGNPKTLFTEKNNGINEINTSLIEQIKVKVKEIEEKYNNKPKNPYKYDMATDPITIYALNNLIPPGERNNILAKNIAIGLYNQGLNLKEAKVIFDKIRITQKDRGIGFEGWWDKCVKEELHEINFIELLNFVQKFIPQNDTFCIIYRQELTKQAEMFLENEEDTINLKEFTITQIYTTIENNSQDYKVMKSFLDYYNSQILMRKQSAPLCYFTLLTPLYNIKSFKYGGVEQDYRIHSIWIAESRTGKTASFVLLDNLFRTLGLSTAMLRDITSAGLHTSMEKTKSGTFYKLGLVTTKYLLIVNEIKNIFKSDNYNKNPKSMWIELLESCWSKNFTVTRRHIELVDYPKFNLMCASTLENAYNILSYNISDGFLARFLFDFVPEDECTKFKDMKLLKNPFVTIDNNIMPTGFNLDKNLIPYIRNLDKITIPNIVNLKNNNMQFEDFAYFENKFKELLYITNNLNNKITEIVLQSICREHEVYGLKIIQMMVNAEGRTLITKIDVDLVFNIINLSLINALNLLEELIDNSKNKRLLEENNKRYIYFSLRNSGKKFNKVKDFIETYAKEIGKSIVRAKKYHLKFQKEIKHEKS